MEETAKATPKETKSGRPKKVTKKEEQVAKLQSFTGSKLEKLQKLYEQWYACRRCHLGDMRELEGKGSDIVFGHGNPDSDILIIGEAPGEEEEATSIPFTGRSGQLLNQMLAKVSDDSGIQELFKWYKDVYHTKEREAKFHEQVMKWRYDNFFITNVIACRPQDDEGKNRQPAPPEIKACWERLYNIIYIIDPKLILAFGKISIEALVKRNIEISKHCGSLFDVVLPGRIGKVTYPTVSLFHPSYLLRKADYKQKDGDYANTVRGLYKALRYVDELKAKHFGKPLPVRLYP